MKKSLLALAVLGGFAGVASAQSSVTLSGTVDLNGRYVKNDNQAKRVSLSQDGINSSQLVFSGVEDLGGGLKASFVLNSGVNADTGTANAKFWNRRATVSLSGGFGEVRLGRDYTPSFWNTTVFDAFGTNGVGSSLNPRQLTAGDQVRADNAVSYFLPGNIGGVYGQVMVAAAENTPQGRYVGGRVGFASGPFDVAVAYAQERVSTGGFGLQAGPAPAANGDSFKTFNVGGAYNFGFLKLMAYFNQDKIFAYKDNFFSINGVVPLGQGEIHVGADLSKLSSPVAAQDGNKVKQFKLGYVYNLSKRTALYGTGSILDNDSSSAIAIGGGNGTPGAGGKSKGFEVGLRHFF
jgi:predicted porin